MASEIYTAREGNVRAGNSVGSTGARSISLGNGMGRNVNLSPSSNQGKNEALSRIADKFNIIAKDFTGKVDDYVIDRGGSYEFKVWDTYGNSWSGDKKYGKIAGKNNNTDITLTMKKNRGRWTGTLTKRKYYGQPPEITRLF